METPGITNNRCERGEILGDPRDGQVRRQLLEKTKEKEKVPNLFALREQLLMKDYPYEKPAEERGTTIGLPKVLFYWETLPFWRTFWRALGFSIKGFPGQYQSNL